MTEESTVTISGGGHEVTMTMDELEHAAGEAEARAQLQLFEGATVHENKAALGAAGDLPVEFVPRLRQRVRFEGEGEVTTVKHKDKDGRVTRQAVIVVDVDTVAITPA